MRTLIEIWASLDNRERRYLRFGLLLVLIFGLISILILPFLFALSGPSWMSFTGKGDIGELINGVSGPFIALVAAVLTFLAFYIQYKANIQQKNQFTTSLNEQRQEAQASNKLWRIERFENKFYELLKLHRANVEEMNVQDKVFGRAVFEQMFSELKYISIYLKHTMDIIHISLPGNDSLSEHEIVSLAFKIHFFGTTFIGESQLFTRISEIDKNYYKALKPRLTNMQNRYSNSESAVPGRKSYVLDSVPDRPVDDRTLEMSFIPFRGHATRLAHYFRHLFQTVKYVADQNTDLLNDEEKYGYIKMIRAQLSNHEQLMLYYNSIAWFDEEWKEYFTNYRLIKNIPLPLANFGIKPEDHYRTEILRFREKGIEIFEWVNRN